MIMKIFYEIEINYFIKKVNFYSIISTKEIAPIGVIIRKNLTKRSLHIYNENTGYKII